MLYLIVLGQNPTLSLAELLGMYPKIKILIYDKGVAVLKSFQKINIEKLGGIPKIAAVLGEYSADLKTMENVIYDELSKFPKNKKIFFGLSFYNNTDRKIYHNLGRNLKRSLKNKGRKARWATSQTLALSSVFIKTNKLLTRGADFNMFFSGNKIHLARTVAVQDFSDYEFRDIKRPARDLVSGMTPPKLAKILINLGASFLRKETLPFYERGRRLPLPKGGGEEFEGRRDFLDPFCGSGTFLGEAALLEFEKIYGSDISGKAVEDSKQNLKWLQEKYVIKTKIEIKECDVKNLLRCWDRKFEYIVTEPYLGPAIRGALNFKKAKNLQNDLNKKYDAYLAGLSASLEKNGVLVLIAPLIMVGEKKFKLDLKIKKHGLKTVSPLPKRIYKKTTIEYRRTGQKIGREIYILKKL